MSMGKREQKALLKNRLRTLYECALDASNSRDTSSWARWCAKLQEAKLLAETLGVLKPKEINEVTTGPIRREVK